MLDIKCSAKKKEHVKKRFLRINFSAPPIDLNIYSTAVEYQTNKGCYIKKEGSRQRARK